MRQTLLTLLCLLLLTPPASAGWLWDRDVEIVIPAHRVGMALRHDATFSSAEGVERSAYLLEVLGFAKSVDAYGIERDVVRYQSQYDEEGEPHWATRCDILAGSSDVVRRETTMGAYASTWSQSWESEVAGIAVNGETTRSETLYTTDFYPCSLFTLAPATLREGQTLWFDELFPGADHASGTAVAAEFEGRDALDIAFETSDGTVTITLADGLPTVARGTVVDGDESGTILLTGYREGSGEPVPPPGTASLPPRNPAATFTPATKLGPDLGALDLPYALDEAIANLRADPQMGLDAWLRDHPDAQLVGAYYDRAARNTPMEGDAFETDGGWGLTFGTDRTYRYWYSSRSQVGLGVGPLLPSATRDVQNFAFDEDTLDADASYSFGLDTHELADGATFIALAESEGVNAPDVKAVEFFRFQSEVQGTVAYLRLSDVSISGESGEGKLIVIDAQKGALSALGSARVENEDTGLLALAPGGVSERGTLARSNALNVPATGVGIAAAAAAGLGLLALLVKLILAPLYSRLRRDRLLDNPVRARLYERVRADPGLHRAELVDFAGIGEGATRHHLTQLVKNKLLVEIAQDGFTRYFAAGEVPPEVARRQALLRAGSHRAVYDLFAAEPTLSLREAGARLGMSAPSVHRAKKKLVAAGLLGAAADAAATLAEV